MAVDLVKRAERNRRAQARYKRTAKGKATDARYKRTATYRAAAVRYRSGARGQQVIAELNARRIFVGGTYRGRAQTSEQAAAIQDYAREKIDEFVSRQQAGAHLEGGTPSAVFAPAADRADRVGGIHAHPGNRSDEGREGDGTTA